MVTKYTLLQFVVRSSNLEESSKELHKTVCQSFDNQPKFKDRLNKVRKGFHCSSERQGLKKTYRW